VNATWKSKIKSSANYTVNSISGNSIVLSADVPEDISRGMLLYDTIDDDYYLIRTTDGNEVVIDASGPLPVINNHTVKFLYINAKSALFELTEIITDDGSYKFDNYSFYTIQSSYIEIPFIYFDAQKIKNRFACINELRKIVSPNYVINNLFGKIWARYLYQKNSADYNLGLKTNLEYAGDQDICTRVKLYAKNPMPTDIMSANTPPTMPSTETLYSGGYLDLKLINYTDGILYIKPNLTEDAFKSFSSIPHPPIVYKKEGDDYIPLTNSELTGEVDNNGVLKEYNPSSSGMWGIFKRAGDNRKSGFWFVTSIAQAIPLPGTENIAVKIYDSLSEPMISIDKDPLSTIYINDSRFTENKIDSNGTPRFVWYEPGLPESFYDSATHATFNIESGGDNYTLRDNYITMSPDSSTAITKSHKSWDSNWVCTSISGIIENFYSHWRNEGSNEFFQEMFDNFMLGKKTFSYSYHLIVFYEFSSPFSFTMDMMDDNFAGFGYRQEVAGTGTSDYENRKYYSVNVKVYNKNMLGEYIELQDETQSIPAWATGDLYVFSGEFDKKIHRIVWTIFGGAKSHGTKLHFYPRKNTNVTFWHLADLYSIFYYNSEPRSLKFDAAFDGNYNSQTHFIYYGKIRNLPLFEIDFKKKKTIDVIDFTMGYYAPEKASTDKLFIEGSAISLFKASIEGMFSWEYKNNGVWAKISPDLSYFDIKSGETKTLEFPDAFNAQYLRLVANSIAPYVKTDNDMNKYTISVIPITEIKIWENITLSCDAVVNPVDNVETNKYNEVYSTVQSPDGSWTIADFQKGTSQGDIYDGMLTQYGDVLRNETLDSTTFYTEKKLLTLAYGFLREYAKEHLKAGVNSIVSPHLNIGDTIWDGKLRDIHGDPVLFFIEGISSSGAANYSIQLARYPK